MDFHEFTSWLLELHVAGEGGRGFERAQIFGRVPLWYCTFFKRHGLIEGSGFFLGGGGEAVGV